MDHAPIVLFVYNRPDHALRTLKALSENFLADESVLYIYSDGPKSDHRKDDVDKIDLVRKIIEQHQWCKSVEIIRSETNKGLAASVIEGVTEVINKYGKIIVLEDDLIPAKGFLKFMNDCLSLYEDNDKVMHVGAYAFPVKQKIPEYFFLYGRTSTWGWGTWKRAWKYFNPDAEDLLSRFGNDQKLIRKFNYDGNFDYYGMLEGCVSGKVKSWGIRWCASVFLVGGYGLWCGRPLIQNIGHDATGINCSRTSGYDVQLYDGAITVEKSEVIEENIPAKKIINKFLKNMNSPPLSVRILRRWNVLRRLF